MTEGDYPQYVTSRFSKKSTDDLTLNQANTLQFKGNFEKSAWGELTAYTLTIPCFMIP